MPFPGSISSFFFNTTSLKWSSASCTCRTWMCRSRRGFLSRVASAHPGALLSRGVRGEEGEAALVAAPLPPPPLPLPGERMWESFSRKSSLNERARRASLPPRAFPPDRSSTSDSEFQECSLPSPVRFLENNNLDESLQLCLRFVQTPIRNERSSR